MYPDLIIKMMNLVAFVQDVAHHFWRWRIYNCGRYYIGHVSMILILRYFQLWIRVELANGCKMNIAPVKVNDESAYLGVVAITQVLSLGQTFQQLIPAAPV